MGSGVSKSQQSLHEHLKKALEANVLQDKPLDASDIKELEQAKEEVKALRVLALQLYKAQEDIIKSARDPDNSSYYSEANVSSAPPRAGKARAAIFAGASPKMDNFEVEVYEKDNATTELLLKAISDSILFKSCEMKEKQALVASFQPRDIEVDTVVIKQGEQGDDFFVVETGALAVFVMFPGGTEDVEVRAPYTQGETFGELALMYNNPRAATIKAKEQSKVWVISRQTVRAILTKQKMNDMKQREGLLQDVSIGGKKLTALLSPSELAQLAAALDSESFQAGDCIVRQGESGDAFYIIESGEVSVFKYENKDNCKGGYGDQVHTLKAGDYFGERALLSEETRAASCVASENVICLSIGREDFDRMLGSLSHAMAEEAGIEEAHHDPEKSPEKEKEASTRTTDHKHYVKLKPEDLEVQRTLGAGAFGNVKLVKSKETGEPFALKCQAKSAILENELQEHVLDERRLLMELNDPFILKLHSSFQDDHYIYFVLELLIGGELFLHLRQAGRFSETDAKFYAGTVLHVFDYLHERKIAYRDLKPENLVLDRDGFVKIVDFGLAKEIPHGMTWTICGTPDYLAPEIILNEGHDHGVDYWALGVLIYEMIAGVPPFFAEDPMATYEKILGSKVSMPDVFSKNLRDILRRLLKLNKSKRLGRTKGGAANVMKHKWYSGFDWDGLTQRTITPPIVPKVSQLSLTHVLARSPTHTLSLTSSPALNCRSRTCSMVATLTRQWPT
ncbi:unnamed protein product [Chrysoparadoxa australica]